MGRKYKHLRRSCDKWSAVCQCLYHGVSCVGGIRDSSVSIATGYGLDGRVSIPSRSKIFLFSTESRPALGTTHSLIQWVPGALPQVVKKTGRGVKLTAHLHLVPRSRMVELYLPYVLMAKEISATILTVCCHIG
jgi:hypothetical protein